MVSTMTTHNVGRRTAITRGGGISEQDGREGERFGDQVGSGRGSQGDGRDGQESNHGRQGSSRGNRANGGGGGVLDFATFIAQQTMNNGRGGCSYKEFMACNPKAYHGKGGTIVCTCWIEKMELVQDMGGEELCPNNEMQKLETEFWCHAIVRAGHAAYTGRFYELARLVPYLGTPKNKRIKRMLTDEAIKNEALKKVTEKRGNNREPSRDRNARNDNKRSRTGRAFATITNPVRKEYTGPRIVNPLNARNPTTARGACFECGGTDHYKATCPRLNRSPRPGGNHPNQMMDIEGGQGRGNNGNDMYEYCKYNMKTVKTGQTRTWEWKECTRAGNLIAKSVVICVIDSNPTASREDLMIGKNGGFRLRGASNKLEDLEASISGYKYKSCLTHRISSLI
ncbi:hypothetical protein Tco_1177742 [Tanacetum coccineum]